MSERPRGSWLDARADGRLQTVLEKLLEDVSFSAEDHKGETLVVDSAFVDKQLAGIAKNADLSRYVL